MTSGVPGRRRTDYTEDPTVPLTRVVSPDGSGFIGTRGEAGRVAEQDPGTVA